MLDIPFGAALGTANQDNASGFIAEKNFCGVFEVRTPSSSDDVAELINEMRSALAYLEFPTFDDFESFLATHTRTYSDEELSYACYYQHPNEGAWMITKQGAILLKRGSKIYAISRGTQKKEGLLQPSDVLALHTASLIPHLTALSPALLKGKTPKEISDTATQAIHTLHALGACLVVQQQQQFNNIQAAQPAQKEQAPYEPQKFSLISRQAVLRVIGVLLVAACIGFGAWFITGRIAEQQNKQAQQTIMATKQKLQEAKNSLKKGEPKESAQSLEEIKNTIDSLRKKNLSAQNKAALDSLAREYKLMYDSVGNMDITADEPFFDMRLVSNQAQASYFSLIHGTLIILDQKNNKIYAVSVTDKDVEQFSPAKDTKPTLVTQTANGNVVYFDKEKGLYQSQTSGSFAQIVKPQKQWKTPIALTSYGTNLYLLDKGADELFKYTPVEGGYSDSLSYFASGSAMDLSSAKGVVIDFSVYLLTNTELLKFKAGTRENFSLADSITPSSLATLYTDEDSSYLYGLDKARSRVIVLDKDGVLLKSVFNPKLKDAKGFGVFDDTQILFLHESSILSLDNSQ